MKDFKSRSEAIASFVYAKSHKEYSTLANTIDEALASAYAEGLEAGAKVADLRADTFNANESPDFRDGQYLTARELAEAIRALKETEHGKE